MQFFFFTRCTWEEEYLFSTCLRLQHCFVVIFSNRSCVSWHPEITQQMVKIRQESGNKFLSKLRSSFGETSNTLMLLYSNLRAPATHTLQLCLLTWNRNRALWWDWRFIDGGCQVIIWNLLGGKKPFCVTLSFFRRLSLDPLREQQRISSEQSRKTRKFLSPRVSAMS